MSKVITLTEYEADLLDMVFTEAISSHVKKQLKYALGAEANHNMDTERLHTYSEQFITEVRRLCDNISGQYDEQSGHKTVVNNFLNMVTMDTQGNGGNCTKLEELMEVYFEEDE